MTDLSQKLIAESLTLLQREGFSPELLTLETRLEQLELSSIQLVRLRLGLEQALGHPLDRVPYPVGTLQAFVSALVVQELPRRGIM